MSGIRQMLAVWLGVVSLISVWLIPTSLILGLGQPWKEVLEVTGTIALALLISYASGALLLAQPIVPKDAWVRWTEREFQAWGAGEWLVGVEEHHLSAVRVKIDEHSSIYLESAPQSERELENVVAAYQQGVQVGRRAIDG